MKQLTGLASFAPGIRVQIRTTILPYWIHNPLFGVSWGSYVRGLNGTVATIKSNPRLGSDYGWTEPGTHPVYFVGLVEYPDWEFAIDWLSPLTASFKIPCNCPLKLLMNRGCLDPQHQ